MNRYLVSYECYFALSPRSMTVDAVDRQDAVQRAIQLKREDPSSSIESGGVKFDSFRVVKKLRRK